MADAVAFDLSDPAAVLLWVRGAVARLAFPGIGPGLAKQVAPAAHLNRIGLAAPAYDVLQEGIKALWGVEVVIPTNARVQEVADAIRDAYAQRADAREAGAS
ncbi:MAG TPA: hypothetical protein VD995_02810 [Azospirillum sp.]|nr:hypothetical protein [Azospirillum sp.]